MKASVLSLIFLSGLAAAQIPDCATSCVTKYTTGTSIAGCGQLDIACICKNDDFLNGIACCLASACDKDGQAQAVKYAKQICSSAGVSTPDNVVCNENSSSSATESATATDDSSSTATTGSSESTTAESSSETTATDNSSSAAATTNSASRTTASSVTSASQTASSASQTSTNVAAPLASAGSLVGAAIAVLAAAL
ncbi:hypothetical protein M440DRAFT_1401645 [Trichoderma longibrachiatum ATCC 18648]|uniref:CFEM domain-containing protein n=1 Tax=Trichoderma longibrachiatum ATCC 18648 TaxID=983965 RepID=A0A2T4C3Q0_TRILO|nr:hypothetical protein M440DRAFT_1401645 [Trichoderma longibrachiatum ATCC 18648]